MFKKIFITTALLLLGTQAYAQDHRVTPYGDYCKECTIYGTSKSMLPVRDSVAAIGHYYKDKNCRLGRVYHKGRFIEAEIYQDNRLVDKVLFDRKTSRIRSIF